MNSKFARKENTEDEMYRYCSKNNNNEMLFFQFDKSFSFTDDKILPEWKNK